MPFPQSNAGIGKDPGLRGPIDNPMQKTTESTARKVSLVLNKVHKFHFFSLNLMGFPGSEYLVFLPLEIQRLL